MRPVHVDDGEALHALLVKGLPEVIADQQQWLARWHWQYWDNPYRHDRPAGWVLTEADRVVGHLGAVYLPVRVRGARTVGVIGADYVVSEEAQVSGAAFAGLQLAQAFFTGTAGCIPMATTANEKTNAVFARFGCRPIEWTREFWRAPATLRQMIRTCRGGGNAALRRLMTSVFGNLLLNAINRVYHFLGHTPALPVPSGCRVETATAVPASELGGLWETIITGGAGDEIVEANLGYCPEWTGVTVDRTEDYLQWRYGRHPQRGGIRVLTVRRRDGRPLGAAIVFIDEQSEHRTAFVEEMIVYPKRADVFCCLLSAALALAREESARYLVCNTGRLAHRGRFWELGFESRVRSAPAATIGGLDTLLDAAVIEELQDHVELQHGEMF